MYLGCANFMWMFHMFVSAEINNLKYHETDKINTLGINIFFLTLLMNGQKKYGQDISGI